MKEKPVDFQLFTKESPRQILREDFKSISELPIKGGWGYDIESAVIIDKKDPIVVPGLPFDGIGIEYVFVDKRLFEELIIFRPNGQKFIQIEKALKQQRTPAVDGVQYDHLIFDVTAIPESLEFSAPPDKEAGRIHFISEFWFDISSFY